jgi:lysozyme
MTIFNMTALTNELVRDEALKLKPYRCTAGKLTIGIGRNLEDRGITQEEAYYLLQNDILQCCQTLDRMAPWWRKMSDARQRALINMCFNLGETRLRGFRKMLLALELGNYPEAYDQALDSAWATQVGDRAKRIAEAFLHG